MHAYRYLIVGGGMTGHAAAAAIRERDPSGSLGMVGEEAVPPYARPPLSKGLWTQHLDRRSVFLPSLTGLVHHAGRRAVSLDVGAHEVVDDQGEHYGYERLLIATGGRPRRLHSSCTRVIHFRTLDDYDRLRAAGGTSVVVVGGGFIGTELASSLRQDGREVTMIFPETGLGARAWPAELSGHVTRTFEERGVRLLRGHAVSGMDAFGDRLLVRTNGGASVLADVVVAGLGIEPNTSLAESGGLNVSDGIDVDEGLRTSAPDVWAAGDVARVWSPALGERVRVEHEDNALTMGHEAGRAMTGEAVSWHHLPSFYSDLFEFGYEAVGKLDARLEMIASWQRPFREGVVYYLEHQRVKGVLLWGIQGQVEAARELIRRQRQLAAEELLHAIPA
jgi:3-phenylpropionate/trans-cinnamate dioxygenase ferredoxin reductase component